MPNKIRGGSTNRKDWRTPNSAASTAAPIQSGLSQNSRNPIKGSAPLCLARRAFSNSISFLRKEKQSLVIFPKGKTPRNDK